MKISRSLCLLIVLGTAVHVLAQSSASFVPIFEGKGKNSADFVDGKTIVAEVEFVGLDQENSDESIQSPVYKSDFLKSLREQQMSFDENEPFSGYKAHFVAKQLKESFSKHGYEFANVAALG